MSNTEEEENTDTTTDVTQVLHDTSEELWYKAMLIQDIVYEQVDPENYRTKLGECDKEGWKRTTLELLKLAARILDESISEIEKQLLVHDTKIEMEMNTRLAEAFKRGED